MDKKRARYAASIGLIAFMVAAAELTGLREAIFPEIAALAAGMWVIDKQVWRIGRRQAVGLMTLAALAGYLLAGWEALPGTAAIALAFAFAAACQIATRTSLPPMLSACMLPIVLGADSLVYPAAVFLLMLLLCTGQREMERRGIRGPLPPVFHLPKRKTETRAWARMLAVLLLLSALPLHAGLRYCILPPLVVTFVEFARPGAGLHKAAGTIYLQLVAGALLGAGSRYLFCVGLGLPATVAAVAAIGALFALFERQRRIFAPAGAVALVPLLIPAGDLWRYPLEVAAGAAVFIAAGRLLAREKAVAVSSH